jgi:chromosome segregation ATPase
MSNQYERKVRAIQDELDRAQQKQERLRAELRLLKEERARIERKAKRDEIKKQHATARKERAARRSAERRANGLCQSCGKQAAPSTNKNSKTTYLRYCEKHQTMRRESERKRKGVLKPRITALESAGGKVNGYGSNRKYA